MKRATTISLQLASFDTLRMPGSSNVENIDGLLFFKVGADTRAAVTTPSSHQAFRFLLLGIHEDEASAYHFLDHAIELSPWLSEATERWAAILQPFHHKGEANYLEPSQPGKLFETLCESPGLNTPIVVLTTSGWIVGDTLDMNRVKEFSEGVLGVRASMTGVDGLHSQQSFFFPGVLTYDPITVALWRDAVAVGKFAYGAGAHKMQLEKQKAQNLADRTSFTRCKIIRSEGTWHGSNPHANPGALK
jgi:hypothetical protein